MFEMVILNDIVSSFCKDIEIIDIFIKQMHLLDILIRLAFNIGIRVAVN